MINRDIETKIIERVGQGLTIVIYGPRQVGKTTLLHKLFDDRDGVRWFNGDNQSDQQAFSVASVESLRPIASGAKIVIIDEAQRIENIGLKLKILHDNFSNDVQFIATGSSSFDLANKINEPMTGRKWTFWLPPLTAKELVDDSDLFTEKANLENRLRYGHYPGVVTNLGSAEVLLDGLAGESLYRDVLDMGEIIKTDKLRKILQALAMQLGNQVVMSELAETIGGIDRKTVDKYISLLEQSFIIFRLPSFSRNLRNELKTAEKIYFYDVGIRNAILNDFRPTELRVDKGALFENYVIAELKKRSQYANIWFWRNTEQQEIDFIAERDGEMSVIEVKWSEKKKIKFPPIFMRNYKPNWSLTINSSNYASILAGDELKFLEP